MINISIGSNDDWSALLAAIVAAWAAAVAPGCRLTKTWILFVLLLLVFVLVAAAANILALASSLRRLFWTVNLNSNGFFILVLRILGLYNIFTKLKHPMFGLNPLLLQDQIPTLVNELKLLIKK